MALLFLKKIADKILGRAPAKKESAKKEKPQASARKPRSGVAGARPAAKPRKGAKPDRKRATGGAVHPTKEARPQQEAAAKERSAEKSRVAPDPKPRIERGPRRLEPENPDNRPIAASGRSVARPHEGGHDDRRRRSRGRRGGGGEFRSANTNPGQQRPGGAVSDEERARLQAAHAAWSIDQFPVEPEEGKKRFHDFDLPSEVMHGIADLGFKYCTPIQALSLEHSLAGKNVAGRAQTGTGKTAAFLVAILTRYLRSPETRPAEGGIPRTLVLAPTRELVIQIAKDAAALGKYCGLRTLAVYGGMDYDRQKEEVRSEPVDLLVATPGRLLDFIRSRVVDLSHVDTLVIDEADRMLDMGFIPDVRTIIHRLPPKEKRSTMLYSATLSEDVMRLASQWMEEPVRAEVESEQVTTDTVKQVVYVVTAREKFTILYNHIRKYPESRILIFCNRRHTTEEVANGLMRRGVRCEMLSGDVNQSRRLRVLEDFREGKVRIVVATDVAGRGLHVDDIGFVINFDFPYEPEDYVHRIGRTGRAGASGVAISFADEDESFIIPDIEKYIGEELKCTMLQSDDPLLAPIPSRGRGNRSRHPAADEQPAQADGAAASETEPAPAPAADQAPTVAEPAEPVPETQPEPAAAAPDAAATPAAPVSAEPAAPQPEPVPAAVSDTAAPVAQQEPPAEPAQPAQPAPPAPSAQAEQPAQPAQPPKPARSRAPFIRPRNEPFNGGKQRPAAAVAKKPAEPSDKAAGPATPPPSRKPAPARRVQQVLPPTRFSEEWVPGEGK